jgi:hypothetical protein
LADFSLQPLAFPAPAHHPQPRATPPPQAPQLKRNP